MKLVQVLALFVPFGFSVVELRRWMAQAKNTEEAVERFELMKTHLQVRWDELREETDAGVVEELQPVYDRIIRLRLTKAVVRYG